MTLGQRLLLRKAGSTRRLSWRAAPVFRSGSDDTTIRTSASTHPEQPPRPPPPLTADIESSSTQGAADAAVPPAKPIYVRRASVSDDGTQLSVGFGNSNDSDDETAIFHAPWLWSNDPSFFHPSSGQRMRSPLTYFSSGARLVSAQPQQPHYSGNHGRCPISPPRGSLHPVGGVYQGVPGTESMMHVVWETDDEKMIHSYYAIDWLFRCRYTKRALRQRHAETTVTKDMALQSRGVLHESNYATVVENDENSRTALYELLGVCIDGNGVALITNVPSSDQEVEDQNSPVSVIGKILSGGRLSHGSLYGDVFSVKAETTAVNIAYTSVALSPHQDLAYYESPPGFQLLHCLQNSPGTKGGESVLVDALAAAEEFRHVAPDLFDVLTTSDATFLKQREGGDMMYRRPHIVLDAASNAVVSVHWSPPFEGPLSLDSDRVQDYYVAYSAFERMIDNSLPMLSRFHDDESSGAGRRLLPMLSRAQEHALCDYANTFTWEKRLQPGEMLVFNNQRMLHGRRSFQMMQTTSGNDEEQAQRHLMGCYTNIDDTMNVYRLLRRSRFENGHDANFIRNVGNGSSGTN